MAQPIWNASTKSYLCQEKTNPKDRIDVEIGDAEDPTTLHPQVKIKRWDNEVNASIRLIHANIPGNVSYSDDGTKITWQKKQGQNTWKAIFYHRDDLDEGGFEFEIHLPAKPPQNYLEFSVNTKNLNWFYQPELTQEEIDRGDTRPENVVGSYAVYHSFRGRINDINGLDYKVGKAFHVYRPHIVDVNNNETWGTLELDEVNGILRISVDQTWLDNAVYPVVVDPTIGYKRSGGSLAQTAVLTNDSSNQLGRTFNLYAAGTLSSFTASLRSTAANETISHYAALYREDSAGSGSHDLIAGVNNVDLAITSTATWYTFTASSEALTADDYTLSIVGNGEQVTNTATYVAYDSSYGMDGNIYSEATTGAGSYATRIAEDPWTESATVGSTLYSLYATYVPNSGQTVKEYLYYGTTSWAAPAGVTSITVEAWGAGGGGGDRTSNGVGGGGGGGAYVSSVVSVTPEASYDVSIPGYNSGDSAGGSATFDTDVVVAVGGSGCADNTATGANGGAAASCTGDTRVSGGAGGTGGSNVGGGGGEAGGAGGTGDAGDSGSAGGAGGSGVNDPGGDGGAGKSGTQGAGTAGKVPGGGGGGAYRTGSNYDGGNGAAGLIIITYTAPSSGGGTSLATGFITTNTKMWGT